MPVLLPMRTHCWHWLSRWPDESNSTRIRFALLSRFAYQLDSNRLFPALVFRLSMHPCVHPSTTASPEFVNLMSCGSFTKFTRLVHLEQTWTNKILMSKIVTMTPNMLKNRLLGPFCHHSTLNGDSLDWIRCVTDGSAICAKWGQKVEGQGHDGADICIDFWRLAVQFCLVVLMILCMFSRDCCRVCFSVMSSCCSAPVLVSLFS